MGLHEILNQGRGYGNKEGNTEAGFFVLGVLFGVLPPKKTLIRKEEFLPRKKKKPHNKCYMALLLE